MGEKTITIKTCDSCGAQGHRETIETITFDLRMATGAPALQSIDLCRKDLAMLAMDLVKACVSPVAISEFKPALRKLALNVPIGEMQAMLVRYHPQLAATIKRTSEPRTEGPTAEQRAATEGSHAITAAIVSAS